MSNHIRNIAFYLLGLLILMVLSGCVTYHEKNIIFHQALESGHYKEAVEYLEDNDDIARGRNSLLYYMDMGIALHLLGDYVSSNEAFEKAYVILEEFSRNHALTALSFLSNPTITDYAGEDYEKVQIHYYKALNFALMGNINDALVECRRINIKLNIINDKYESGKKNHYGSDAFAWNLMGMLFDSAKEYNNAFVCYRNALETYETHYIQDYGVSVPEQLKFDLVNAADRMGLSEEVKKYRERFQISRRNLAEDPSKGEVVVIWNNGLCPVKTENSINFFLDKGDLGVVSFVNEENNLWFPVPAGGTDSNSFKDVSMIRLALPQFHEREQLYYGGTLTVEETEISLEKAQDINGIALLNLQDRMGRELGKALARLAIKKSIEKVARNEDQTLGTIISIVNAISEKADTRNWQSLPHTIYYARFTLPAGTHNLVFRRQTQTGEIYETTSTIETIAGRMTFLVLNDPQSEPIR